ncbi:MAG TPA: Flp family type IVb pilin [Pirellulales bacterium]|nr:Flp family type IVb pilin [Pirellulales bacterium]
MRELIKRTRRFLAAEEGPTAVEYAVMLSLVIMICIAAIRSFGANTKALFINIGSSTGS